MTTMRLRCSLTTLAAVTALAAAGCSDEEPTPVHPAGLAFVADAPTETPAIYASGELTGSALVLTLHGKGLPSLYGVGFRLGYDPSVLALSTFERADGWSADAIAIARESVPGSLTGAITARGDVTGLDASDAPLAVVRFDLKADAETTVSFVTERSFAQLADGSEPSVSWYGGAVRATQ